MWLANGRECKNQEADAGEARRAEFCTGGNKLLQARQWWQRFSLRLGGRKQRVELLTPDSEIIFSRSWQLVTGTWQRAHEKGWWHFPAAQRAPRMIQPLCKGDRLFFWLFFSPLFPSSWLSLWNRAGLIPASPHLRVSPFSSGRNKDQIIRRQMSQYEHPPF